MLVSEEELPTVIHYFEPADEVLSVRLSITHTQYTPTYIGLEPTPNEIDILESEAKRQYGVEVNYVETVEML